MSDPRFWFGLALGCVAMLCAVALLSRRRDRAVGGVLGEGEVPIDLPMTRLQQRAWWALGIGSAVTVGVVWLLATAGPSGWFEDDTTRFQVYLVFGIGLAGYGVVLMRTRSRPGGEVALDERDRAILERAPKVQVTAVLLTLAAFAIALTEVYWDAGQVPIAFPFLMFLCACVVGLLAFAAGVLIGYRRA